MKSNAANNNFSYELHPLLDALLKLQDEEAPLSAVQHVIQELDEQLKAIPTPSIRHTESSSETLRAAFEASSDGMLVVDRDGCVRLFNKRFCDIWGLTPQDMYDHSSNNLVNQAMHQLKDPQSFVDVVAVINNDPKVQILDLCEFKDGRIYERSSSVYTIRGRTAGRIWSFRDVTESTRQQKLIEHQALHDGLTGLPNRTLFEDRLEQAIGTAQRSGKMLAVLFIDLDRFKMVNDSLGHAVGDALIREVAQRLNTRKRRGDTVARLGGDEFIVIVGNLDQEEDAVVVAKNIMQTLQPPIEHNGLVVHATASIGISLYPRDGETREQLVRNSDTALYAAKEEGRNMFCFYEPAECPDSSKNLQLEQELRTAIKANTFELHYQPQVTVNNGDLVGAEALLRWRRPDGKYISPARFIPIAENAGLINPLGDWVLEEGIRQFATWNEHGLSLKKLSLNVSGLQLYRPDFAGKFMAMVTQLGVDPTHIVLEITETVLLNQLKRSKDTLLTLRQHGIRISMDDFGTGHSSLSQLQALPIDQLKIDRSFIMHCHEDYAAHAILTSIISMAHSLSLEVVAEGVETPEQFKALYGAKCDYIQGYLFSKPLSTDAMRDILEKPLQLNRAWRGILAQ